MKQLRGIELKRFNRQNEKHTKDIILILENIQYANNVASIFRTADAIHVNKIILTGISHKPPFGKELRQTSREKEKSVHWEYEEFTAIALNKVRKQGYTIVGLEITDESKDFKNYRFDMDKICIVVGNEGYGIVRKTMEKLDSTVFIPMYGKGASLNVSVSLAVLLYKVVEN
ncbi:tRNA methyltransferase [Candidatus Dojkabacteria bacterium]|nr:tRNA methyltransferase [Candidatus Dojkabacteria bacterium]